MSSPGTNSINREDYELKQYQFNERLPFESDNDHGDPYIQTNDGVFVQLVKGRQDSRYGHHRKAVRKCIMRITGAPGTPIEYVRDQCGREVNILRRARHNHVVGLVTAYFHNASNNELRLSIIMDSADGNLRDNINTIQPKWFGCLVNAVDFIHGLGIRHGNIKPENILIKSNKVLLADFGLSRMGLTGLGMTAREGSKEYSAPEVGEGRPCGRSADIFSLGAVFLNMLFGRQLQDELQKVTNRRLRDGRKQNSYALNIDSLQRWMAHIKPKLQDHQLSILSLCQKMLDADRDQRPRADELTLPDELQCRCESEPPTKADMFIGACKKGKAEEVQELLDNGANPNTKGALHQACVAGNEGVVKALVAHKYFSDINLQDYGGQTALHCAAGHGNEGLVRLLLDRNAHTEIQDFEGRTALFYAAGHGFEKVVQLLLNANTKSGAKDYCGQTSLHLAAKRGHEEVVRLLLNKDPDALTKDNGQQTPLYLAVIRGHVHVARLLLDVAKCQWFWSQSE